MIRAVWRTLVGKAKNVAGWVALAVAEDKMDEDVFVTKVEQERRRAICRACSCYNQTSETCSVRGALMDIKVKFVAAKCELDSVGGEAKW